LLGTNLRNIITQAGGPDDTRLHNRMIRFPKTEAEGNSIRVEGQRAIVDKICASIQALVDEQESQTADIAEVKPDKHRLLIGRGGETRRQLEQQFGVTINVPRQNETGDARSQVRIAGQPANVEKAKAHILELTKDMEGETISVPRQLHHSIADNGQFFRRLRNDHKVTVDHAGQRPPPKPSTPTPTRANGASMPLITDDPAANAENHHWEIHDLHAASEEGDIPWVLSGPSTESVSAARAKLDKALEEARKQDTMGFLILPDPRAYRYVIGPGGSEINRIRKQTGTKVQVPRDQNKGEAIEIAGSKAGVEDARDLILEIVQNNA
jgi:rRNA processing protein Krr1/Pno1